MGKELANIGDLLAQLGMKLFFTKSLGLELDTACASCHSGDFFTDEKYYVLCIPQVGIGKGDGPTQTEDFGRYRGSKNPDIIEQQKQK